MKVSADDLIAFAKTLEGQTLQTLKKGSEFKVVVTEVGMDYTPLSTGNTRHQYYNVIKKICDHFSETNSFSGKDYKSFTANSSYVLAIINKYIEQ